MNHFLSRVSTKRLLHRNIVIESRLSAQINKILQFCVSTTKRSIKTNLLSMLKRLRISLM